MSKGIPGKAHRDLPKSFHSLFYCAVNLACFSLSGMSRIGLSANGAFQRVNNCQFVSKRAVSPGTAFLLRCLRAVAAGDAGNDNVTVDLGMRQDEMQPWGRNARLVLGEAEHGWELAQPSAHPTHPWLSTGCSFIAKAHGNALTRTSWDLPSEQNTWIITAGTFGCASWARPEGRMWEQPFIYPLYS